MSRALDKDVLQSLKLEDPIPIYTDIATVLSCLPDHGRLLDIELLGKAHPLEPGVNYLQDEAAVAIPKLRLTQAFFVAHRVIQKHISLQHRNPTHETVTATAVALLMDPEHLTAANIRKRYIVSAIDGGAGSETLLRKEKQLLDSLLTARLHRHTKSPTLWSHRRWLLEQFRGLGYSFDLRHDINSVVMVAADRHPRNYYAWHHAKWLIGNTLSATDPAVLLELITDAKDWCFRHHTDISGWSFLGSISFGIQDEQARLRQCFSVFTESLNMARSFRWTNESVWVFLRTIAAMFNKDSDSSKAFVDLNRELLSASKDELAKRQLEAAARWCSDYRQGSP